MLTTLRFRQCLRQSFVRAFSSTANPNNNETFGIVFDVDGVLYRGKQDIPQTTETLKRLRKENIPFLCLTNGGGKTEDKKAIDLSKRFGIEVSGDEVILAHTPMKSLVSKYENELILVAGQGHHREICESYGFKNIVTTEEFHSQFPTLYPDIPPPKVARRDAWHEPVKCIFVLMDPYMWRDMQILMDVVRSKDGVVGTISKTQTVPIYFSNPDMEYSTDALTPRFGSGPWRYAFESIYQYFQGHPLKRTVFGKPYIESYQYAEVALNKLAKQYGHNKVTSFYAVGDNPLSDIQGANMMGWHSILVRTGVFKGSTNDETHPASYVCDHVGDAVDHIFCREMRR